MAVEKIAFVYPTLIRPGMIAGRIYKPDLSIHLNQKSEKYLIAVTVGIMFNDADMYFSEIDILYNDDSVLSDTKADGTVEIPFVDSVGDKQQLRIYSMFASSVNLDNDGVYRVVVRTYRSQNGEKSEYPITEGECYFYVSHTEVSNNE